MVDSQQLETAPYLVTLEGDAAQHYTRMRQREVDWLKECKQQGCTIVWSGRRQSVVLAPQPEMLPQLDLTPYHKWREVAVALAEEQGKKSTVGSRSSQAPTWITSGGGRAPLSDPPPNYRIQRLRYRTAQAARGARIGPNEAIQYVGELIRRAESSVQSSYRYGHKNRIADQKERVDRLNNDFDAFRRLVIKAQRHGQLISVQALSGKAWRITARTTDKQSIHASISTIAVMPCTNDVLIEPASTRQRRSNVTEQVVFENIRMRVSLYERQ